MTTSPEPRWVRLRELPLAIDADQPDEALGRAAAAQLGLHEGELEAWRIVQRALDARQRTPRYVYAVELALEPQLAARLLESRRVEPVVPLALPRLGLAAPTPGPRPVVVGSGPAGLFAALTLAQAGWPPIILERGREVDERAHDVSRLYRDGVLDADSNVCFGEGGAGTFSDGKLLTRVHDARVRRVLEAFVTYGAHADILIDNRPHLGTDRLVRLLRSFRRHLQDLGVTFRFGCSVEGFTVRNGAIAGLALRGGESLEACAVVLGTGHSARDVWQRLDEAGIALELRPFAMGFRVEHAQTWVNQARYGQHAANPALPAADYRLTYNQAGTDSRGVYSFCMCPGGVVVPTPTRPEELCTNGMSHASRAGRYANSALVVTVGPADFAPFTGRGVFAGVAFQEEVERGAYLAGGGGYCAPAARLADFAARRASSTLPSTSYRRGVAAADLTSLYPAPIIAALQRALRDFDRKMRGFVSAEATLIGVETRTASPIRLPRGNDRQATSCRGLYPAGEGMGYGGGIVSAAVDGMHAAEAMLLAAGAEQLPAAAAG